MSHSQITSVSIPRFDSAHALKEHLGLPSVSDEREALIYFSIGLQLGGIEEQEIATWARAYSYTTKNAPDWVWDVLDPEIDVVQAIQKNMPFEEVSSDARFMMVVLQKLIDEGKINLQAAMPHIADLKWKGSFPELSPKTHEVSAALYAFLQQFHSALSTLLDAWHRMEVLGGADKKSNGALEGELQERYAQFCELWKRYTHRRW